MDIFYGHVDFLGQFVVFHYFCAGAEGDLSRCIDERTRIDDEIGSCGGYYALGMCCCEDCGEELFILDGTGLFNSN